MSKTISAFRGSLDLYYQVEDDSGNFGQVYDAGNVTNFSIGPDAETVDVLSTKNADYGQAADSMTEPKPTTFSFNVNRMNIDNWAVGFMGEYAARTASSATVTDEAVSAVQNGMFIVEGFDISAVTIQDSTDTTTFAEGTDYEIVDPALGIIRWLAADTDLHVDYTTAAESGYLLSGGTKSSRFLRVWGRGINRFTNKRCLVKIGRGSVKTGGNFSFVGTDPSEMQFEGTANIPADGSAAFEIITDE